MHNPRTPYVLETGGFQAGETIIDSGPVKSKYMAHRTFEATSQLFDRRKARSSRMLNADWVASSRCFYYVAFDAGLSWEFPWPIITELNVKKHGRRFATLNLHTPDQIIDLQLGKLASNSLLKIYSELQR